ncbi:MAG: hypothetical protein QY326_07095 [Bdellovibrionota bacterium]|nr:MAG: hypothetical protein QY326_07095 [Bdellovibrionota bacterium]
MAAQQHTTRSESLPGSKSDQIVDLSRVSPAAEATLGSAPREAPPLSEVDAAGWREIVRTISLAGVSGVDCSRRVARAYGREAQHPEERPEIDDLLSIGMRLGDAGLGQMHTRRGPLSDIADLIRTLRQATECNGAMILQITTAQMKPAFILVHQVVTESANPSEAMVHLQNPDGEDVIAVRASVLAESLTYSTGMHIDGVHGFRDLQLDRSARVEHAVTAFCRDHPWLAKIPGGCERSAPTDDASGPQSKPDAGGVRISC